MLRALLSTFGYDQRLVGGLPAADRQKLGTVAAGWLLSLLLIAVPAGYALWLVEHSLLLAIATGVGAFALTLNLLRVATAGGGVQFGSSRESLDEYRPGLGPAIFVAVLGLIFAQPAQLPLNAGELEPAIAAHRELLVEQHRTRVGEVAEARALADYRAELASCEFVVKRLALLWQKPERAARFSVLYCLVILLPALFSQFVALDAVRRYQLARYRHSARLLFAEKAVLAQRIHAVLSAFPGYRAELAGRALDGRPLSTLGEPLPGQLSLRRRSPP